MYFGRRGPDAQRRDPYQAAGRYREPTQCCDCGAVFRDGRWAWGSAPEGTVQARCPACRRIRERMPAGSIVLEGAFVAEHRAELVRLIRREAEHELREHPLHRLIELAETTDHVSVATTDIQLPQRIGEAVKHLYEGRLTIRHGQDEYSVRAYWRR